MFKTNLKPRHKVGDSKKARRFAALAFFLFLATPSTQGQTNVVSGTAYGTNDLSEATSIASVEDGVGTLRIGFSSTTNLALGHDISGFIVISNQAAAFTITATNNAAVTSSGGPALTVINATNLSITGGQYLGGQNAEALDASNSDVTIEGGTFNGGINAAGVYARNSDLTINGGTFQGGSFGTDSYYGLVSIADAAQTNDITLNGGTFSSIDFAGSGVQLLTTATDLQVDDYVVLDGGTLVVDNASSSAFQNLWIRSGNIRFQNNYSLFSGGRLELLTSTNNAVATFYADTATFETNSTIDVDAFLSNFSSGTNDVVVVSTENGLSVIDAGGNTNNATDANLAQNVNLTATTSGRTVLSEVLVVGGTNMVYRFTTESLRDYWNAKGPFGVFTDELESLITPEMDTIITLIDNPWISGRAVEQTYFTTFNSFQTALQGMRAAVGQSVARGTQLRDQKRMVPRGARGPMQQLGQPEGRIRGWGKYYGNYYTHSDSGLYPSYDSRLHGGVLGIDTSIGKLIIGISGGASHYDTDFDGGGSEDTTAAHGNLYGTYGAERGYIDAGIAYGRNRVDTRTADPFRLDGDYDAHIANFYLGGGYDLIDTKGGTVFTPEIAIQYAKYKQDSYTETGIAAVPRVFDEFDSDSLLSSVGMNIAMQNRKAMKTFAFQLDGRLHWMHEFNPDPSNIDFRLAGGRNSYPLDYPSLDEEIYRIGIGCSFFNTSRLKPGNVVFRVDFDELFGDDFNSHNLSAKVLYAF